MPLIIDHPSLVPLPRRLGWGCVTILFWLTWIYLWMPFLTLAAWSFGFFQAYSHFQWEREVMELKRLLVLYSMVVAVFGGALLMWALLEYVRFRHKHRRSTAAPVLPQDIEEQFGLPAARIIAWQACRCVVAYHDDHGMLTGADSFHLTAPADDAAVP
ncbi:MAG: poly-beta-1,6-N-acetyl-D-glucosamine biosynthesis protein PgaD [Noviherbaspirillum sp.]